MKPNYPWRYFIRTCILGGKGTGGDCPKVTDARKTTTVHKLQDEMMMQALR